MKQVLGSILASIAARPPVLINAFLALLIGLGIQVEALEPYRELILIILTPLFGYWSSRLVVGPETGKTLAKAVSEADVDEVGLEAKAAAGRVLGNAPRR